MVQRKRPSLLMAWLWWALTLHRPVCPLQNLLATDSHLLLSKHSCPSGSVGSLVLQPGSQASTNYRSRILGVAGAGEGGFQRVPESKTWTCCVSTWLHSIYIVYCTGNNPDALSVWEFVQSCAAFVPRLYHFTLAFRNLGVCGVLEPSPCGYQACFLHSASWIPVSLMVKVFLLLHWPSLSSPADLDIWGCSTDLVLASLDLCLWH